MKTKLFTIFLIILVSTKVWAYDFIYGGLYYNITSSVEPYTVSVTYQTVADEYHGIGSTSNYSSLTNVVIPEYVMYNSKKYMVTSIGKQAFHDASLESIIIPSTVKSLGYAALLFSKLNTITLPESITSIPYNSSTAFPSHGCCISADTIVFLNPSGVSIGQYISSSGNYFGIYGSPVCYIPCGSREKYDENLYFRSGLPIKIEEFQPYSLVIDSQDSQNGIITTSQVDCVSYIISAIPKDGYTFIKWSDGNTQPTRYIELTEDITLTAYFAKEGYTIHVYQDCNTTTE